MKQYKHVSPKVTPQTSPLLGENQIQNHEGGYVYGVSIWDQLDRFLILGTAGGTFYVSERKQTLESAENVLKCIKEDCQRVVDRIVEISDAGRAHKNDHALFALALCLTKGPTPEARNYASNAVKKVARTGGHILMFAEFVKNIGGWGRAQRRAFTDWYNSLRPDQLAFQVSKYKQRGGWTHRDILRLAHPVAVSPFHDLVFKKIVNPDEKLPSAPAIFEAIELANTLKKPDVDLIRAAGLTREMIPTSWLKDAAVWQALIEKMPLMATIRNLGVMSANDVIRPFTAEEKAVIEKLVNPELIKKSRIHPMHYFLAAKTYGAGQGFRSDKKWHVNPGIVDALNEGFHLSFDNIEPSGKNFYIGVDVSRSMGCYFGGTPVTCSEAAAVLALTIAKSEPNAYIFGFDHGLKPLKVTKNSSIQQAINACRPFNYGGTDCELPMIDATKRKLDVDVFIILTDSETWYGDIHPSEALREFRSKQNKPDAKLVVVAMTATDFSIADPADVNMLDIVGFDASVPSLINEFVK